MSYCLSLVAVLCLCGASAYPQSRQSPRPIESEGKSSKTIGEIDRISFREFYEPGAGPLKYSGKLLGLQGKRVQLIGFMAELEDPPKGGFYLCPRPVFGDESGAGTADLPMETVRVITPSSKGKVFPFISRAVEVTGILEIGNREEDDGSVSSIRLILDRQPGKPAREIKPEKNHSRKSKSKSNSHLQRSN